MENSGGSMPLLRCHLLIGPPGSGKTTIAEQLSPLLEAQLISTDVIRNELYGDPQIQGRWVEIESRLHELIQDCVANNQSVLIDATHALRPWRLALTQSLVLSQPVEWIGWWLQTPLETCLIWNKQRDCEVPEDVIKRFSAALGNQLFAPDRSEGFACIVEIDPAQIIDLGSILRKELDRLPQRIAAGRNRESGKELHGYSRLLDVERLLYLIQLLTRFPGLSADNSNNIELERICYPKPEGSIAQQAAAYLSHLRGNCYGDVDALEQDLLWLEAEEFFNTKSSNKRINPPKIKEEISSNNYGGWPALADVDVFTRIFTLLRYLLQNPFAHKKGMPLTDYLIKELGSVYLTGETATLRKDIERILTPYGFRDRNDNARHGYGIGTAVLSAARLREVHQVISLAASRLSDPIAQNLIEELEERLRWSGILNHDQIPVRTYANRSIVHPDLVRHDSLAIPQNAERLEVAIINRERVLLERFIDAAKYDTDASKELNIWPLQFLFHNIAWYLAYEEVAIGKEHGLIKTERLDRLSLRKIDTGFCRSDDIHTSSVARLSRLIEISGGIYFGENLDLQLQYTTAKEDQIKSILNTVRFRCTFKIYKFLREGFQRYPLIQMRISKPLPQDRWKSPSKAPVVLEPLLDNSHPFPVEIDLPIWTIERDIDFKRWLFGYGAEIIIESPLELKLEHIEKSAAVVDLYRN